LIDPDFDVPINPTGVVGGSVFVLGELSVEKPKLRTLSIEISFLSIAEYTT
jgi:hypothetical protein